MSTLRTNNIANVAGTQSTDVLNVINGSAKAWVNFNGTGTVAIRQGYNVSSITDNGTGNYTVNFANAMPDASYAVNTTVGSTSPGGVSGNGMDITSTGAPSSGSVQIVTGNDSFSSGSRSDLEFIFVSIFR